MFSVFRDFRADAMSRRALSIPAWWRWWKAEKLREHTKNLIVFKEESHKKRDHPVYCSKIKIYCLMITINNMPERLWYDSERVPPAVKCWRQEPAPLILRWCDFALTLSQEKGLRESDETFFSGPDNYIFLKLREKNHTESRGNAIFILIALDYSNLDWWNRFFR